jgi:hypothetical protein
MKADESHHVWKNMWSQARLDSMLTRLTQTFLPVSSKMGLSKLGSCNVSAEGSPLILKKNFGEGTLLYVNTYPLIEAIRESGNQPAFCELLGRFLDGLNLTKPNPNTHTWRKRSRSDSYTLAENIEIDGSFTTSPQIITYDEWSILPTTAFWALILFPIFIGIVTTFYYLKRFVEYAPMDKPLLVTNIGDAAMFVKRYMCGLVIHNNPRNLKEGFRAFRELSEGELQRIGENSRKLAQEEFDWNKILEARPHSYKANEAVAIEC